MASVQQRYKEQAIMTATPAELTGMLYDALVRNIKLSIIHIDDKNFMEANKSITKAMDIIRELSMSLATEVEISYEFFKYYNYMADRLLEANIKKDKEILLNVQHLAEEFADLWKQILLTAAAASGGVSAANKAGIVNRDKPPVFDGV